MSPVTDPNKEKCPLCMTRQAGPFPGKLCRRCYDAKRAQAGEKKLPADLQEKIRLAQQTGDWKKLAEQLENTFTGVADGTIKATAAQASILKHIMDRAYGRVSKTQEEKSGPIGVVLLPTLDNDANAHICAKCKEAHKLHG